MFKLSPLLLCFVMLIVGCSQNPTSLITADTVIDIHKKLDSISQDSIYYYLDRSQKFLETHPEFPDSLRAENSYRLGLYYQKEGIIDSATAYFHLATDLVQGQVIDGKEVDYFNSAWSAYLSAGRFGDCFTISNKLASLLDKDKDQKWLAWVYYFNENTYMRIPDYEKALENNERCTKLLERISDSTMYVPSLMSQARLKYYYLKDKPGAFAVLDELAKREDSLSHNYNRVIFGGYGVFLFYEGYFKSSKRYYRKGLGHTKQMPNSTIKNGLIATAYANLAEVSIELEEYDQAGKYLDSVRALGMDNIDKRLQKSTLKYELRLASLTNNDITKVQSYLDTIYNFQVDQYIKKYNDELVALTKANKKEKKLMAEKQKAEIQTLKLETRFLVFGIGTLFLAALGFLFYRQRKFKFEKQGLQMQQRLLSSQMNPHFTSNTLYSIQSLIEKDQKKATQYLLKFSRQLRLTLENSMQNYVQLEKELNALKEYLELQLLRFPLKFSYRFNLVKMEEDDLIFIPPMLLQPFIENSIEHGLAGIDYPGEIGITLERKSKFIKVIIEDNGHGLTVAHNANKRSASMHLISKFLKHATKNEIDLIDKRDLPGNQSGVIANFLIPYKLNEND